MRLSDLRKCAGSRVVDRIRKYLPTNRFLRDPHGPRDMCEVLNGKKITNQAKSSLRYRIDDGPGERSGQTKTPIKIKKGTREIAGEEAR